MVKAIIILLNALKDSYCKVESKNECEECKGCVFAEQIDSFYHDDYRCRIDKFIEILEWSKEKDK